MRTKWFVLLTAAFAVLTLSGCGSNGGSGGSDVVVDPGTPGTPGGAPVETVGITNCTKCHSSAIKETQSWLNSAHGNPNGSPGSSGPADASSSCQPCHNQLLDGQNLPGAFPAGIEIGASRSGVVYADTARNIASCESCHGGGSAHRGVGPIPFPRPDWEQCTACHDHPEGVRHAEDHGMLASNVGASGHNNADNLHASSTRCQRCHTAEGSVALARFTGDSNVMHLMDDLDPIAAEEDLHPVTCAACHVPHEDSGRWENFIVNNNDLAQGAWDPNNNGVADQFDFCTSCHTYYNQDGTLIGSGSAASGTAPHYHNTAWYRVITTTHYDNPATGYGLAENLVEGYVIRQTVNGEVNESPCFDCHGHELRTNTRHSQDVAEADDNPADYGYTLHTEWASSGHAAGLIKVKYAADSGSRSEENVDNVMAAGADDAQTFPHYNWDAANRQSCQFCHTSTGFMNYAADSEGYDPANNDFSHLAGWTQTDAGSGQNELLYCWGCHENPQTGVLRWEGAVTAVYTYNDQPIVFPDVGPSNTCTVCHSGRGNNEDASTGSRFAGHHAPAAADLFSEYSHVAYEYPGLSYENKPYFAHDVIDTEYDADGNYVGGQGPCVACHMNGEAVNHTFDVVEKDDSGAITAINADVCVTCHDGEHGLFVGKGLLGQKVNIWNGTAAVPTTVTQKMIDDAAEELEMESEGYQDAGQLANDYLNQANGLTNYTGAVINNQNSASNDRGAFQNAKLPSEEPGGFAHNRFYVKRAIFDAIDWIDNGVLDGTIFDNSAAYPEAMHWLGTTRP